MRVGGQHHAPTSLPLGNSHGTHYTGNCGPQGLCGRLWRKENLMPLPRFEPQTVQPVTSHCIDTLSSILIYQHSVLSINRASCADECARIIWTHGSSIWR